MRWRPGQDREDEGFSDQDRETDLEGLRQFGLARPPRSVPLSVRGRLLFGGFLNQFGWLFLGFGMIFFWLFVLNSDLTSWYRFSGELEVIEGTITHSEDSGASVGGTEHSRGTPIYANHYEFTIGGRKYAGASYATGRQVAGGRKVRVEFSPGDPGHSRIQGMRTSMFGLWAALVVIFPAIGFGFVYFGFSKGAKAVYLLAHGEQGMGTLKSKEPTNTRINKRTVYKLTFEFTAGDGRTYVAIARTHEPDLLEDDAQEPLLYDPFNPSYATMLDHLPGSPDISPHGEIRAEGAPLVLILPTATIVGHGLYACLRFL